jgi:hypothetical protein
LGLLPEGFDPSSCTPVDRLPPGAAVAVVDCAQNSLPNGPSVARISLYSDRGALDSNFLGSLGTMVLSPCPDGRQSPSNWELQNSKAAAGQIACGTYNNVPDILYSRYGKRLIIGVQSGDMSSLFQWWTDHG